ncbi:MAG: hypothetical protein WCI93_01560 [bacterium]
MDQNFQTSFIPKKPMVEQATIQSRPMGFIVVVPIVIFLTMVLVSGGAYLYKETLTKNVTQMETDLNLAKNRFEQAEISKLKLLDRRLRSSSDILGSHMTISPIFTALESLTMKTVRYTKFSYDLGNSNKILINMSGQAIGYRSIALQADLFAKNKNLIDPVFSNLSLDDKGNVLFDLTFSVDQSFVNYKQVVKRESSSLSKINATPNVEITN